MVILKLLVEQFFVSPNLLRHQVFRVAYYSETPSSLHLQQNQKLFSLDKIFKIFFDIAIEIKLKAIGFTQNPEPSNQNSVSCPFAFYLFPFT